MERFQKIKNNRRKFDISSICRFCGLENEERYIITQLHEDGVDFVSKVSSMLGIKVHGSDKMPQNVCFICMDKINDFYEFRLMALNTEKQTREALGLPMVEEEEKPKPNLKQAIVTKPAYVRLIDLKHSTKDSFLIQKALQKLSQRDEDDNIPSTSTAFKRGTTPLAVTQPPIKKSRNDISCNICINTYFSYQSDLQDHQVKDHLPLIAKYACGSCRETFDKLSDFKSHEIMHAQSKLPFICYICKVKLTSLRDFQKHMTNFNCPKKKPLPVLVEDIKCFQCKKKFLTQNLFEWHGCFIKTRGTCLKCGLSVQKKKSLLKHYVLCKAKFVIPEAARDPNENSIKYEEISPKRNTIVNISNVSSVQAKGVRKKTVPQRRTTVFKAEKEVNLSHSSATIQEQLSHRDEMDEDDEYANYEEDITYDNFGSDEDEDQTITNLEPDVQLQEPGGPRIIDIKAEGSGDFEAIKQLTIPDNSTRHVDSEIIRNVKREQANKKTVLTTSKQNNVPELRIKPEQAGSDSVVTVLNPLAVPNTKPSSMTARKKVFKLPQQLAMKIKKEKVHGDYEDSNEVRDEAEPDPEEEAQMEQSQSPTTLVKEEKSDSDGKAVKITSNPSKPHKQFINPIALAMMRAKNVNKEPESTSNGSGLLVISAVTSIVEATPNAEKGAETTSNGEKLAQTGAECTDEILKKTQETHADENTPNDKLDEINSGNEQNVPQESSPVMIEIPAEFSKSTEKQHYSPAVETTTVTETTEPDNNILSPIVAVTESVEEKTNELETTGMENNGTEAQAINASEEDELDQLLQKYECGDDNELNDTDLQDLLKFD